MSQTPISQATQLLDKKLSLMKVMSEGSVDYRRRQLVVAGVSGGWEVVVMTTTVVAVAAEV